MTPHEFIDYVIERANIPNCAGCQFRDEVYPTNCRLQGRWDEVNILGPNCTEIVSGMVQAGIVRRLGANRYEVVQR